LERIIGSGRACGIGRTSDEQAAAEPGAAAATTAGTADAGAADGLGIGDCQIGNVDGARIDEQAALIVGRAGAFVLAVERRTIADDVERHAGCQVDRFERSREFDIGIGREVDLEGRARSRTRAVRLYDGGVELSLGRYRLAIVENDGCHRAAFLILAFGREIFRESFLMSFLG
jgi:hypothetical protein